jgi:hypothetical protein
MGLFLTTRPEYFRSSLPRKQRTPALSPCNVGYTAGSEISLCTWARVRKFGVSIEVAVEVCCVLLFHCIQLLTAVEVQFR